MKEADSNSDGSISLEEFKDMMRATINNKTWSTIKHFQDWILSATIHSPDGDSRRTTDLFGSWTDAIMALPVSDWESLRIGWWPSQIVCYLTGPLLLKVSSFTVPSYIIIQTNTSEHENIYKSSDVVTGFLHKIFLTASLWAICSPSCWYSPLLYFQIRTFLSFPPVAISGY